MGWTLSFIRPYRRAVALLIVLSLGEIALRALAPWPMKAIVDRLTLPSVAAASPVPPRSAAWLLGVVFAGFALQLGHQLVLLCHTRVQARLGQSMVFDLRTRLFAHLQNLSLAHHAIGSPADAVYRLENDAACLDTLVLRGLFPLVFSVITLVIMFGVLMQLDGGLAATAMGVVPFLYVSLRCSVARTHARAQQAKALESAVVTRLYESLSAIRLVKMFAREEHEIDRFSGIARAAIRERMALTRQESSFGFSVGAITVAGTSIVLAVGALHVLSGRLSLGTLLLGLSYLGFVYGPLSAIATTTGSLHGAVASARRVRAVLRLPRESDPGASAPHQDLSGAVRFENVSFGYGERGLVLDDVSFTSAPGTTTALVGPSGAGKTTIVSLLARLYHPTHGRITVDGTDTRRLPLRSLREQIAVVPQDSILIAGTIADNILYGRLDASRDEVQAAAAAAGCLEFIERLPAQFDTLLGEDGAGMSGGQRQRLSIARAFLKDAPILILDEPTASLDAGSERAVLAALARLRRGRTTFVIAHRLSTVRAADQIVVLDQGRVAAQGTHSELLGKSALYRQLAGELSAGAQREVACLDAT